MEKGAQVWAVDRDGDDAWILCEVLSKTDTELKLQQIDKDSNVFARSRVDAKPAAGANDEVMETRYEGVELANAKLSEADRAEGRDDDLITLPHLHEPAILHAIHERFTYGKIYTWTGPVLIAVNPFQRLPLYTNEILESYRQEGLLRSQNLGNPSGEQLEPHVYSIADRSFRQMMSERRTSQSILISGESGAGKTESTKIVMLYLTTLGSSHHNVKQDVALAGGTSSVRAPLNEMSIMERVLQSNPILEAFGNARTLRNDNSSRFGKFIELGFSRGGSLLGAKVQTYLLEKVRVGFHASGERNYHIFYQLLRGMTEDQKKRYGFHDGETHGLELANHYHMTGQGGAPQLREFTDEDGLKYTLRAMTALGWTEDKVEDVLKLVAGLIHLGQINFDATESEGGQEVSVIQDENVLQNAATMLDVDTDKLKAALTERLMITRGEGITIQLSPERAVEARDALAKTMYGSLFLWVVNEVNGCIGWEDDKAVRSSVGVLDIFGFECFAVNSFEQLCINFTNEALQQQFNKFIFKMEQAEYEAEQISWDFIEFPDNQDCLDTIQSKPNGILVMLDDECRLPKGSDRNWANRLYKQYIPNTGQTESDNTRFLATPVQKSRAVFCVRHFAGVVQYTAETGFLEKNKDEIPLMAQNLFETAPNDLVKDMYNIQKMELDENSGKSKEGAAKGKPSKAKTVGMQFKEQLSNLMAKVETTEPHYIRCLKPNDAAKPKMLTRQRLTEQLRYGGVLEAIRVARMGFPVRLPHDSFFRRYRMLLPSTPDDVLPWSMEKVPPQDLCISLVDLLLQEGQRQKVEGTGSWKDDGISRSERIRRMQRIPLPIAFPKMDVQLGLTKVFMRKPPHDTLEAHRIFHQNTSAIFLQSWIRGMQQRRRYLIMGEAALTIQRFYRGCVGRARWWKLREADASDLLTNALRMLLYRRRYNRMKAGAIQYQALYRGHAARRVLAATKIQTQVRTSKQQAAYRKLRSASIALQCALRRRVARKALLDLKHEQKDIGKLQANNEKLKMEMASLKAMLQAQAQGDKNKEESEKAIKQKQMQIGILEARIKQLEAELEKERDVVKKLEESVQAQRLQSERQLEEMQNLRRHQRSGSSGSVHHDIDRRMQQKSLSSTLVSSSGLNSVTSEQIAEQQALVAKLEDELEAERRFRREADGEIIKLRAQMSGVPLNDSDVDALVSQKLNQNEAEESELLDERTEMPPEVTGVEQSKDDRIVQRSPSEYFPLIRRGFAIEKEAGKEEDQVVMSGWQREVSNRKEREEALREEVNQFESKAQRFTRILEDGIDVTMWQLNRNAGLGPEESSDEFVLKSSAIHVKLHRRGDLLVQAVLSFSTRGGYLSKALGRKKGDASSLEPLPIHEILSVKAGCVGYDQSSLPSAGKSKSKGKVSDNKHSSLFLTIGATQTPMATSRVFFLRFKSRAARNNLMMGLRGLLADMQVHEGVSISSIHMPRLDMAQSRRRLLGGKAAEHSHEEEIASTAEMDPAEHANVMIPLADVHHLINKEREAYDRLLLMMLQGSADLKEKEDEEMALREKLEEALAESYEKDRVAANDSKLIMQLSKKLETLLMDNEDLRDQNDRLNTRLVVLECSQLENMNS